MKTPLQEHIEWLDVQWGNAKDCGEKTIDFEIAIAHAEQMLEKEKDSHCEFVVLYDAYIRGLGNRTSDGYPIAPKNPMSREQYFDKTFKTKEK